MSDYDFTKDIKGVMYVFTFDEKTFMWTARKVVYEDAYGVIADSDNKMISNSCFDLIEKIEKRCDVTTDKSTYYRTNFMSKFTDCK